MSTEFVDSLSEPIEEPTTTSNFLAQIDREIADNSLPPISGVSTLQERATPDDGDTPLNIAHLALIEYLRNIRSVAELFGNVAPVMPWLKQEMDDVMATIMESSEQLVDTIPRLDTLLCAIVDYACDDDVDDPQEP